MNKNLIVYLAGAAVLMAVLGLNPLIGGIGLLSILLIVVGLEILGLLRKIPILQTLSGKAEKGTLVVLFVVALIFGGYLGSMAIDAPKTLSVPGSGMQTTDQVTTSGGSAVMNANWVFYPSAGNGGTYAGSGLVYVLDPGLVPDRYQFMKIIADGKTGSLTWKGAQSSSMSVSSGSFTKNQMAGRINDEVEVCGILDSTPAAAENISFCKNAVLTGITAGSNPLWMWKFTDTGSVDYTWRNYATTAFYDSTDAARTIYTETEAAAIEKTFTFYTFPSNNGETFQDAALYLEAPSGNAGAIKKVKITSPGGSIIEYTALQATGTMSSSQSEFIASPSLTNTSDTMYYIGKLPLEPSGLDAVRTSNSDKAKYSIETVYDHPASGNVNVYFKAVQNVGAKTSSGGHFDFATTMNLNMTDAGSDGWS